MEEGTRTDTEGNTFWLLGNLLHRLDGPAVEWADGDKSWYIEGFEFDTEAEFLDALSNYNKRETGKWAQMVQEANQLVEKALLK